MFIRDSIKSVATDKDLKPEDVLVNSTTLKDGIIVRYNKEDYTVHPVSYTHLDVYKRQRQSLLKMPAWNLTQRL